ncbi:hypothetical protein [Metamycoplasma canadense]|uniref:hypothetical protein n=1 Tax=Metamycoplasma canadense TaxID=29554 RepID=UPI0005F00870|nr:hypothetical protein [Metamycoplasma canadense]
MKDNKFAQIKTELEKVLNEAKEALKTEASLEKYTEFKQKIEAAKNKATEEKEYITLQADANSLKDSLENIQDFLEIKNELMEKIKTINTKVETSLNYKEAKEELNAAINISNSQLQQKWGTIVNKFKIINLDIWNQQKLLVFTVDVNNEDIHSFISKNKASLEIKLKDSKTNTVVKQTKLNWNRVFWNVYGKKNTFSVQVPLAEFDKEKEYTINSAEILYNGWTFKINTDNKELKFTPKDLTKNIYWSSLNNS